MLEQRSEILSHYHRPDLSFFSSGHQHPFPVSEHVVMFARCPPIHYSTLWLLGHTNPIKWCVENPSTTWKSHQVHILWLCPPECRGGSDCLKRRQMLEGVHMSLPPPQKGSCCLPSIPQFLAFFLSSVQQDTSALSRRLCPEAGIISL